MKIYFGENGMIRTVSYSGEESTGGTKLNVYSDFDPTSLSAFVSLVRADGGITGEIEMLPVRKFDQDDELKTSHFTYHLSPQDMAVPGDLGITIRFKRPSVTDFMETVYVDKFTVRVVKRGVMTNDPAD